MAFDKLLKSLITSAASHPDLKASLLSLLFIFLTADSK
jgi:hypothetical protein